jgi:hypothetical protein
MKSHILTGLVDLFSFRHKNSTTGQSGMREITSKKSISSLYLIGSLRNEAITTTAKELRGLGLEVFDDWMAAGPEADDYWKSYEVGRGRTYSDALSGLAARHVFEFDKHHLDRCDAGLLVLPAGRSGHLELGYVVGSGKPGFILLDDDYVKEGRFDVMYRFATEVFESKEEMLDYFK